MGLLGVLRKVKQRERELRVLVLGLDNAGKTTVVKALAGEDVLEVSPTLGFQIHSLAYDGYALNVWDVGGQKTLRAYWRNYFEQTDALVWVVDAADVERLDVCAREMRTLLNEERLAGAALLVLANKQDLPGALAAEEIAARLGLILPAADGQQRSREHAVVGDRHWRVEPCSAFDAASVRDGGLEAGFCWLIHDVAQRIYSLD
mmetsp:Transcript_12194/g.32815  ORF Transcript_12194/g.32815 Transcript_12194/m.32815 type:complete len:204 (+) Transcript_12194:66-677(+)